MLCCTYIGLLVMITSSNVGVGVRVWVQEVWKLNVESNMELGKILLRAELAVSKWIDYLVDWGSATNNKSSVTSIETLDRQHEDCGPRGKHLCCCDTRHSRLRKFALWSFRWTLYSLLPEDGGGMFVRTPPTSLRPQSMFILLLWKLDLNAVYAYTSLIPHVNY
jgi:hypothetical protein